MANLRPLGRQAKKSIRSDSEISLASRNSHQPWYWPLRTHCSFRKPSRAAMATTCTTSPASLITTISRSRFTNFVCHGNHIRDHGGSSLSALPPNQPVVSHFGTHARGNICNLHCRRSEAQGAKANPAVACSSQCCCCGCSAAGPRGSPSIRASCSSHGHNVMVSIRQARGAPLTYSQLQPSHAATAASAQLVRRRGLATAAASAPEAPASESSPQPLRSGDLDELLYTSGDEAPYYRGPLELREVPDAGVGVFVTEDVPCGTVLLACYPLALLRGRPAGPSTHAPAAPALLPSPMELAHALDGSIMSPLAAAWMLGLYDGVDDDEDDGEVSDGSSGGDGCRKRRRLAQLRQLFRQPFDATSAAAPDTDEGEDELSFRDAAGVAAKGVRCPLPAEAVARVVTFNAYGEARPDPAVAAVKSLSGEHLSGCVGLWPPFSLINHSCAPVASYGLVGDVMVVRAATDLSAGQQVTISYFGRRALVPLELRRAYLAQHYGFICSCERCTLEAAGLEEEEGQQEGEGDGCGRIKGEGRNGAAGTARLPPELPAFLENLHMTCSRAAAPHLNDMLTGRRWTAAAGGGGGGSGVSGAVRRDEPVSELVEELSELYNYLSGCWQQLLRAAAAAAAAASGALAEGEEDKRVDDAAATGGGGLSQQEVFWLEGSVFVLLDQLLVVSGTLGLLTRVDEQHRRTAAKLMASGEAGGGRKAAVAAAAKGGSVRRAGAAPGGKAAGRADVDGVVVVADESGSAAASPPLTALAAMRAVASRRWRVEELPRNFLMPYVDLLAQAQEVAAAVAPGSDLAVACAVRLLYGIQAVLGPESDEFREAEISCYDALSARYGILDYDVYEQILEVCAKQYGAQEVRLPGLAGEAVPAAAPPPPPASFLLDGSAGEGGMVGLHIPAVPVEAEVVEE